MEIVSEILKWSWLLLELGFEVWEAARAGETGKTVGEILAGRKLDLDYLADLEAKARAQFQESQ